MGVAGRNLAFAFAFAFAFAQGHFFTVESSWTFPDDGLKGK